MSDYDAAELMFIAQRPDLKDASPEKVRAAMYLARFGADEYPNNRLTWAEIEELFPDASPQWDVQGGDAWLGDNEPTFVVSGENLAIGYGEAPNAHWALWNNARKRWLFVPRPVKLLQHQNGRLTLEATKLP